MSAKDVIGQVEKVQLPAVGEQVFHARIDTGAKTAAIWASACQKTEDGLAVIFFEKDSPFYTGKPVLFTQYDQTIIASATGNNQQRYKVRMKVRIAGRTITAWFTRADRSGLVYPVLIGRNVLRGKFIVDVKLGNPLLKLEHQRRLERQATVRTNSKAGS